MKQVKLHMHRSCEELHMHLEFIEIVKRFLKGLVGFQQACFYKITPFGKGSRVKTLQHFGTPLSLQSINITKRADH